MECVQEFCFSCAAISISPAVPTLTKFSHFHSRLVDFPPISQKQDRGRAWPSGGALHLESLKTGRGKILQAVLRKISASRRRSQQYSLPWACAFPRRKPAKTGGRSQPAEQARKAHRNTSSDPSDKILSDQTSSFHPVLRLGRRGSSRSLSLSTAGLRWRAAGGSTASRTSTTVPAIQSCSSL